MNEIYNLFFSHGGLTGMIFDTVVFFGMLEVVMYIIKTFTSFGNGRRL